MDILKNYKAKEEEYRRLCTMPSNCMTMMNLNQFAEDLVYEITANITDFLGIPRERNWQEDIDKLMSYKSKTESLNKKMYNLADCIMDGSSSSEIYHRAIGNCAELLTCYKQVLEFCYEDLLVRDQNQ